MWLFIFLCLDLQFTGEDGKRVKQACVTFPWINKYAPVESDDSTSTPTTPDQSADEDNQTSSNEASDSKKSDSDSTTPPNPTSKSKNESFMIHRVKVRSIHAKSNQRLFPTGGEWGFFGYHTVPPNAREVVLTEGEFDAMAVWQCTGLPAISLPNGARSLPVELLPKLERFERIYLWMDDDAAGQEGAEAFARKLGIGRCYIVHTRNGKLNTPSKKSSPGKNASVYAGPMSSHTKQQEMEDEQARQELLGPKDANDALIAGMDLMKMISEAKLLQHEQILTFKDIRQDVLREFAEPVARKGVQSTTLPSLNRILKGHR